MVGLMLLACSAQAEDPHPATWVGAWTGGGTSTVYLADDGVMLIANHMMTFAFEGAEPDLTVGTWRVEGGKLLLNGSEDEMFVDTSVRSDWTPLAKGNVEAWAKAWAARDYDAYAGFYTQSKTDKALPFNEGTGVEYLAEKKGKLAKARCIEVTVADVRVVDQHKTVFKQMYVSDTWCDEGEKTLTWFPGGDGWLITAETQPKAESCSARCM